MDKQEEATMRLCELYLKSIEQGNRLSFREINKQMLIFGFAVIYNDTDGVRLATDMEINQLNLDQN